MGLTMHERKAVTREYRSRYRRGDRKTKSVMLDEFTRLTGYERKYAARILADAPAKGQSSGPAGRRGRPSSIPAGFQDKLVELWYLFDCLCGKRLVPLLRQVVPRLVELGECAITPDLAAALVRVSAATVDRLLVQEKRRNQFRGTSATRPGAFLKRQIPIRTFADWNDARPGFVEADLVVHDGGASCGDFLCTLTMTDVATGWTEPVAQLNRAQKWTFQSIQTARSRLPFPLLGIDTDNGSEFLNCFFVEYCRDQRITFTRSRPYRKNDNCFVEQKNNSVVRRCVGYPRYESPEALALMNRLYENYRLMVNFFLPSAKLLSKTRSGSSLHKRHDAPRSPFDRVLAHPDIDQAAKTRLSAFKASLNPAQLAREVARLQDDLVMLAAPIHHIPNRWHIEYQHPHGKFSRLASS